MLDYTTLQPDLYKYVPAGNYSAGRNGKTLKYTVLHHNAGKLPHEGVYNAFIHNGTSAHYNVDIDGTTCQYVDDWDTAYHAGNWAANCESIGIEHCDADTQHWTISDATLEEGAHLVAAIHYKYNLGKPEWMKNVFPHSHFASFASTACPGSIAGSQRDKYMERAQYWYDVMAGGSDLPDALKGYTDLDADAWYIDAVAYCVGYGYMCGSGTKFRPLDKLSRADAVCVIMRVGGYVGKTIFTDVKVESPYYYGMLDQAKEMGIIHGSASGAFRPTDAITRGDFVVMLYNAFGMGVHETIDVWEDTPTYAKDAIAWAMNRGIITKIAATQECTRAEAAAIIYNFHNSE